MHYMFLLILPFTLRPITKLIFPSPNMGFCKPTRCTPKAKPFCVCWYSTFHNFLVISPPITKPHHTLYGLKSVQAWLILCLWLNTKITSWSYTQKFLNTIIHIRTFGHKQNPKCSYNCDCFITNNARHYMGVWL